MKGTVILDNTLYFNETSILPHIDNPSAIV